ncbi:hypothetical protein [Streptomyces sp. NPDC020983]|uniref:hypothetical protein n=1 Tax=Streptomyces sp. NPDC020983 TaxID=3365106 RepID=UPI003798B1AB
MAADQGIETAKDGVAEVSMTSARAHLTELIRGVRYGRGVAAFKERGERRAYVVTPAAFEQAQKDRAALDALVQRIRHKDPLEPGNEVFTDWYAEFREHIETSP